MRTRVRMRVPDPRVEKLPEWARTLIKDIQRERDVVVQQLKEFVNTQEPSPFWQEEWICDGESEGPTTYRNYIQTNSVIAEHEGVRVELTVQPKEGIMIRYNAAGEARMRDVYCTPVSYQQFRVHKEPR